MTSYWQAEWVKKLRWKTIELPSPLLYTDLPDEELDETIVEKLSGTFERKLFVSTLKEVLIKKFPSFLRNVQ